VLYFQLQFVARFMLLYFEYDLYNKFINIANSHMLHTGMNPEDPSRVGELCVWGIVPSGVQGQSTWSGTSPEADDILQFYTQIFNYN
jgi:hypothetical protein